MKYAIIQCSDGNYRIVSEGITNIQSARIQFHQLCASLWNDSGTEKAMVMVADENLNAVEGLQEYVTHPKEQTNVSE